MDKLTRIKTLIACAIVALGFSSCSEDQTSLSIDNIQGKAIIKGSFVYDDNKTSSSSTAVNTEKPVMNTTVYVMINNSSFNNNSSSYGGYTTLETTTDAQGKYEIEIPAVENGVTVTIKAKSFEAPYYKINSNSGSGTAQNSVIAKDAVYSSPEIILSDIKPNDIIAAGKATYNHKELEKPSSTINAE